MIDKRRAGRYERIYEQLQGLIEGKSPNLTAAMATICAVLHHKMNHHFWTGFYFVAPDNENELHIGPYQGTVACQVLKDSGVSSTPSRPNNRSSCQTSTNSPATSPATPAPKARSSYR